MKTKFVPGILTLSFVLAAFLSSPLFAYKWYEAEMERRDLQDKYNEVVEKRDELAMVNANNYEINEAYSQANDKLKELADENKALKDKISEFEATKPVECVSTPKTSYPTTSAPKSPVSKPSEQITDTPKSEEETCAETNGTWQVDSCRYENENNYGS